MANNQSQQLEQDQQERQEQQEQVGKAKGLCSALVQSAAIVFQMGGSLGELQRQNICHEIGREINNGYQQKDVSSLLLFLRPRLGNTGQNTLQLARATRLLLANKPLMATATAQSSSIRPVLVAGALMHGSLYDGHLFVSSASENTVEVIMEALGVATAPVMGQTHIGREIGHSLIEALISALHTERERGDTSAAVQAICRAKENLSTNPTALRIMGRGMVDWMFIHPLHP